ncbi:hypothetical protein HDU98_009538, partial [Podochytrium sp. JEL0797]
MFACLNSTQAHTQARSGHYSKEKEVQQCLDSFRRLLRLQHEGHDASAVRAGYALLFASRAVSEAVTGAAPTGIQDSPLHILQFGVHANYAALVVRDDVALAREHYRQATAVDPTSTATWLAFARCALETAQVSDACMAFERALHTANTKVDYWYAIKGLAEATFAAGDFESCLPLLEQALLLNPSYSLAVTMRTEIENEKSGIPTPSSTRVKLPAHPIHLPPRSLRLPHLSWTNYGTALLSVLRIEDPTRLICRPVRLILPTTDTDAAAISAHQQHMEIEHDDEDMIPASPLLTESAIISSTSLIEEDDDDDLVSHDLFLVVPRHPPKTPTPIPSAASTNSRAASSPTKTPTHLNLLSPTPGAAASSSVQDSPIKENDNPTTPTTTNPPTTATTPVKTSSPSNLMDETNDDDSETIDKEAQQTPAPTTLSKRKKRFMDLETRTSTKRNKRSVLSSASFGDDTGEDEDADDQEADHDLLTTSEFYEVVADEVLPTTGPFRDLRYGEDEVFVGEDVGGGWVDKFAGRVKAIVEDGGEKVDVGEVVVHGEGEVEGVGLEEESGEEEGGVREYIDGIVRDGDGDDDDGSGGHDLVELTRAFLVQVVLGVGSDEEVAFRDTVWPKGLTRTVVQIVCEMQTKGVGSGVIVGGGGEDVGSGRREMEFVLCVCELLFDHTMHLHHAVSSDAYAATLQVLEAWWSLLTQTIIAAIPSPPLPHIQQLMGDMALSWWVRKLWLQGQLAEHVGHTEVAVEAYKTCLEVCVGRKVAAIQLVNCKYNNAITPSTIKHRLQSLSLTQYLHTAHLASLQPNHPLVLSYLHPFLFQDNTFSAWFASILFPDMKSHHRGADNGGEFELCLGDVDRKRVLRMLVPSYDALEMVTEGFLARLFLVQVCVKGLMGRVDLMAGIEELSTLLESLLDLLQLNEPTDLFQILHSDAAMLPVLDFMGYASPSTVHTSFIATTFALTRLAWTIVSKCGFPKYRTHTPLVTFAIRSWSLMYYISQSLETRQDDCVGVDWAFLAHAQLGEVGRCKGDGGRVVKMVVRGCLGKKGGEGMSELYQAFCCLYGVLNT